MGTGYIDESGEYCESYTERTSLTKERRKELQPSRMAYAKTELQKLGITFDIETDVALQFKWKGETVILYPFTGWHTGKSIKDGRGIKNLLKQLK